mmetsp:Transcript_63742/g.138641  ORF Transcript_63742/g.138641 Transcript_63742/m.138641 type:complete len:195 (-) Transcript_63742:53-637(-)
MSDGTANQPAPEGSSGKRKEPEAAEPTAPDSEKKKRSKKRSKKGQAPADATGPPPGSDDDDPQENSTTTFSQSVTDELHRARINEVLNSFTPEEDLRFQCFYRSKLPPSVIRRMMAAACGYSVNQTLGFVMGGIGKILVGELVETARIVKAEWGEGEVPGPLLAKHYREAYRRIAKAGAIPGLRDGRETPFTRP